MRDRATRDGQQVPMLYARLRSAILRGEIAPGASTSQVALANQLGVSRTPLREALRMLEREGLVLSEPNRRARIAEFSTHDVQDLYVARVSMEAVAVRISVPTLTPDDFADIEGLLAQMDYFAARDDWQRAEAPHREFHSRLIAGAGGRVTAQLTQLAEHAMRYRFAYGQAEPDNWPTRRAEHRAIVDAAAANDPALTAERLVAHYARTALVVIAACAPDHTPHALLVAMQTVAPGSVCIIRHALVQSPAGRMLARASRGDNDEEV